MTEVLTLDAAAVDRYADVLATVGAAVAGFDFAAAETLLEPIADDRWMGHVPTAGSEPREPGAASARDVSDRLRAAVFRRDGFRCSYCGGRAVPRCVLVAVSEAFPRFGYHPHYRRGAMHPAFWALAPEADHTVAHSRGGAGALENLTTMHALCNTAKSDALLTDLPVVDRLEAADGWDGLLSAYPALVEAGNTHGVRQASLRYHPQWLRLFGLQPLGPVVAPASDSVTADE
ncbi:HNH endonuclease [Curtobacterium sp. MCBD17_040]|uniref:HNH endonuclease n=1 Tax=Curtobacterium sp. MCBD17_040 TaxID=2175674 RepID=UPI0011B361DB|nr:HNH endonuclease [Curtobacterium sp. MCBD17_040]WIB65803.1 HNH endonuclease [Curtobacterium sp. MCBD17_040]